MKRTKKRSLNQIKIDVVKHDLDALGLRLMCIGRLLSEESTKDDIWKLVEGLGEVRQRLLDTESQDLPEIIDRAPGDLDIPF